MTEIGVRDVAERAGVSPGTVSNYFNRPTRVAAHTALRIEAAVEELGYVPNEAGRTLRVGSNNIIGLLSFETANPFSGVFLDAATTQATTRGFALLSGSSSNDPARELMYLDLFERQRVAGALLSPLTDLESRVRQLRSRRIPSVLLDWTAHDPSISTVGFDDVLGGRLAAEHLLELGHEKILFLGDGNHPQIVRDRKKGALAAVEDHPHASLETVSLPARTSSAALEFGRTLKNRDRADRPTAIIGVNDLVAIGVLHALLEDPGTSIPDDYAIIGFDDIQFAADSIVPLSSIRRPGDEFGRLALDVLAELILQPDTAPRHELFLPTLVPRTSTTGKQ